MSRNAVAAFDEAVSERVRAIRARAPQKQSLLAYAQAQMPGYQTPRHIVTLARQLEALERGDVRRLMVFLPPRHGKQVADSVPVMTPRGWVKHGKLKVGGWVFGPDGFPTRILAIGAPSNEKVEVELTDGSVVRVHPEHEWTVFDRGVPGWRTVETQYIAGQTLWSGERARFQLPRVAPLQLPERDLPLDPYTLGAWLGDGTATAALLCGSEEDLAHIVARIPYERTTYFVHKTTGVHYQRFGADMRTRLRAVGVLGRKHIPALYLMASEAQRRALLAGLVDTDGSVDTDGRTRFITVNRGLADGVVELVRGLGYRAGLYERKPAIRREVRAIVDRQVCFEVAWTPHDGLGQGTLPRKHVPRWREPRAVGIKAVRACAAEPGRCITVDRHDGLYLVGRSLVPTHNSQLASQLFPAWYLGRNPRGSIICASYGQELADDFGRRVRNLMASDTHGQIFPGSRLAPDSSAAKRFDLVTGGTYFAVGRGGPIVGRGGNILIDDPIKDRGEAESEAVRRELKSWYSEVAYTRLPPGGWVCVIQTRWHQDDLAGWLLSEHAEEGWQVVSMPALAEEDEPDGRREGEALWPERFSRETLLRVRDQMGGGPFAALYQQRPTALEGAVFKRTWWCRYDIAPPLRRVVQSWDTAFKAGRENDYSACTTWGETATGYLLLHAWRGRVEFPELIQQAGALFDAWSPAAVLIEDKASGQSLIQTLRSTTRLPITPVSVDRDKVTRASGVTATVESGRVAVPARADWLDDYLSEMSEFPNAKHDDYVDSTVMALEYLTGVTKGLWSGGRGWLELARRAEEERKRKESAA